MPPPTRPALFVAAGLALTLAACTDPMSTPLVVDGPRDARFMQDEAECRALVEQQVTTVNGDGRAIGRTAGGAATAAVFGGNSGDVVAGATIGMISGITANEQELRNTQRAALLNCMRGRGHNVIN